MTVHPDSTLQRRICAEYREMPGMRLTASQAARLFNLEPSSCVGILQTLVRDGELWTDGHEFLGRHTGPSRRPARARS